MIIYHKRCQFLFNEFLNHDEWFRQFWEDFASLFRGLESDCNPPKELYDVHEWCLMVYNCPP